MRVKTIGVIGGGTTNETVAELARSVGREIGKRGFSLVCGGLGGVMQAACEGLQTGRTEFATSSLSIGILPGPHAQDANEFVDIAIPTGIGIARNLLVVRAAGAVIVIDGSSGTLSEVAFAWQLDKPIVALANSGGVASEYAGQTIDAKRSDCVLSASSAEEAVEMAVTYL